MNDISYVNLLPRKLQTGRALRRCARHIAALSAIASCLIVGVYLRERHLLRTAEQAHQVVLTTGGPIREAMRRNTDNRRQLDALKRDERQLAKYLTDDRSFQVMSIASAGTQACRGMLRLDRIGMTATAVRPEADKNPKNAAAEPQAVLLTLSLQGVAKDQSQIAEYVKILRNFEVFETVDLKSTGRQRSEGPDAQMFLLECRRTEPL